MQRWAFEGLEPCDGKLSRTVLRGKGGRKAPALPGRFYGVLLSIVGLGLAIHGARNPYL
jgi:hypothetical protein